LTLDYDEDLIMFNIVDEHFKKIGEEPNLRNIIAFLDTHPEIAKINQSLSVKYKDDKTLIDTLNRVTKISVK
ncbi:MAG: dehydrogenase, partial [Bacteroidetes bacterium]|nr:dehydrogenase [Bacteroidota bacterium]